MVGLYFLPHHDDSEPFGGGIQPKTQAIQMVVVRKGGKSLLYLSEAPRICSACKYLPPGGRGIVHVKNG